MQFWYKCFILKLRCYWAWIFYIFLRYCLLLIFLKQLYFLTLFYFAACFIIVILSKLGCVFVLNWNKTVLYMEQLWLKKAFYKNWIIIMLFYYRYRASSTVWRGLNWAWNRDRTSAFLLCFNWQAICTVVWRYIGRTEFLFNWKDALSFPILRLV